MALWLKIIIGITAGFLAGGLIGFLGRSGGGSCPLTCSPWRSAFFGLVVGLLVVVMSGCASNGTKTARRAPEEPPKAPSEPVREKAHEGIIAISSAEEFDKHVLESEHPVLVKFHAKWCGACRILAPTIEGLSEEYAGRVGFVQIDVDKGGELARKYEIRSIPAVFVFKDGEQLNRIIGAKDAATYRSALDSALEG